MAIKLNPLLEHSSRCQHHNGQCPEVGMTLIQNKEKKMIGQKKQRGPNMAMHEHLLTVMFSCAA